MGLQMHRHLEGAPVGHLQERGRGEGIEREFRQQAAQPEIRSDILRNTGGHNVVWHSLFFFSQSASLRKGAGQGN